MRYTAPIMFFLGWKNGINMNPFTYEKNVIILLFVRCLLAMINNYWVFKAIQLIPLSKFVAIYCLAPFWSSILGAVILNESVSNVNMFWILGAIGGTILLMLNRKKSNLEDGTFFGSNSSNKLKMYNNILNYTMEYKSHDSLHLHFLS